MDFVIRQMATTVSTNDDALRAAEQGEAEGLVIWAMQQSAGRGRQGRQWHSPEGNLYFSALLRPPTALRNWGLYSFAAALAVGDVVRALLPQARLEFKWPNDVLVNGKKISGILLEVGEGWLVVGMGVNVSHIPPNPLYPVTSLALEKIDISLEDLLRQILSALNLWYDRLNTKGFASLRTAWLGAARKGPMQVRLPKGDINGVFSDLDEDGNLRLRLPDGSEQCISTGDVFF